MLCPKTKVVRNGWVSVSVVPVLCPSVLWPPVLCPCMSCMFGRPTSLFGQSTRDKAPHAYYTHLERNDEPDLMARITSRSGARLGANARLGWREHYPSGTNIPQMQDVSIAHSAAHGQPRIGSLPTWPPLPPLRFGSSSLSRADWVSPFGSPTP